MFKDVFLFGFGLAIEESLQFLIALNKGESLFSIIKLKCRGIYDSHNIFP